MLRIRNRHHHSYQNPSNILTSLISKYLFKFFNQANTVRTFTIICLSLNIYSTIIKVYSHFLIQKLVRLTCRILRFLNKSLYFADFSEIKTRPSDIQISLNIFHNLSSPSYRVICMLFGIFLWFTLLKAKNQKKMNFFFF